MAYCIVQKRDNSPCFCMRLHSSQCLFLGVKYGGLLSFFPFSFFFFLSVWSEMRKKWCYCIDMFLWTIDCGYKIDHLLSLQLRNHCNTTLLICVLQEITRNISLVCCLFRQILPLAQEWFPARVLFRHHRRECYKRVTRINIQSNTCCLLYEFMNFLDRIKGGTRIIRIAFNFQWWSWWKTCI